MKDIYLCLGADAGPCAETMLRAAVLAAQELSASAVTCSAVFGDRHRHRAGTINVNMVAKLQGVLASDDSIRATLSTIEHRLGRVRDPDRQLPVAIDIDWVGTLRSGSLEWSDRYDPGRHYVWHGLFELGDAQLIPELDRLAAERDFGAVDVGRAFFPLMSAKYATALAAMALDGSVLLTAAAA